MNFRMRANLSLRKFRVLFKLDWCTLKQDFDNFVNKFRFQYVNSTPSENNNSSDKNSEKLEIPPPKKVKESSNFLLKATAAICLEAFIEKVE